MKQLLNTLFVTSEDIYLSLDGENVVASREKQAAARYPLHTLSGIISFAYPGASPLLFVRPGAGSLRGSAGKAMETYCCAAPSTERRTILRKAAVWRAP